MVKMPIFILGFIACLVAGGCAGKAVTVPKPIYDDPVYHGAADPVVLYNPLVRKWWMFYTNRRASIEDSTVAWVHGTRIGMAESKNGVNWKYIDTANIEYFAHADYTHWAPAVIEEKGTWHMYLTYVPGIFKDWNHPREIIHLTSRDMRNWKFESVLPLGNHKVIDAELIKMKDGTYRMWYNNESDKKSIYYADSRDLYHWEDKGKAIQARGEGPSVFYWKDKYFMIIDAWKGMEVWSSADLLAWDRQKNRILEEPGKGKDDQAIGGHCDVVVNNGRAFIFYFTHPGRNKIRPADKGSLEDKRSVIQMAELKYETGEITCDRDAPLKVKLVKKLK